MDTVNRPTFLPFCDRIDRSLALQDKVSHVCTKYPDYKRSSVLACNEKSLKWEYRRICGNIDHMLQLDIWYMYNCKE